MKPTTNLVAAALCLALAAGCVPDRTTIEAQGTFPVTLDSTTCALSSSGSSSDQKMRGYLNLALFEHYYVSIKFRNNLSGDPNTVAGVTVDSAAGNDFTITDLLLSYSCAGSEFQIYKLDLLTSAALDGLYGWAGLGPDLVTVNIGIALSGHFAYGGGFTTEPFNFPLDVREASKPTCPSSTTLCKTAGAPCDAYFGQDSDYGCCSS